MKTKIAIMMMFTTLGIGITRFETNHIQKKSTDSWMRENDHLLKADNNENPHVLTNDQYFNSFVIVEVLSNYSAAKMEEAITLTYDKNILEYKNAFVIMNEMSGLIKALRNADSAEVIFEEHDLISLKVMNRKKAYQLDIHFKESSEKIEKIEFNLLSQN